MKMKKVDFKMINDRHNMTKKDSILFLFRIRLTCYMYTKIKEKENSTIQKFTTPSKNKIRIKKIAIITPNETNSVQRIVKYTIKTKVFFIT